MQNPPVQAYNLAEKIEEESPILIVTIDVTPLVAAAGDMPYRTRVLEAKGTRHLKRERGEREAGSHGQAGEMWSTDSITGDHHLTRRLNFSFFGSDPEGDDPEVTLKALPCHGPPWELPAEGGPSTSSSALSNSSRL